MSNDRLVGEATLQFSADVETGCGVVGKSACLELSRDGIAVGTLMLQYHILNIDKAFKVLRFDSSATPSCIVEAVSCVLSRPENVDRLVDSRPVEVLKTRPRDQIRNEVEKLVREFNKRSCTLLSSTSSGNIVDDLAPVARMILDYVSHLVGSSSDAQAVCIRWLGTFFAVLDESSALDRITSILHRFFHSARARFQDVKPVDIELKAIDIVDMRSFHNDILADKIPQETIIGRGSYAVIWRGRDQHTGKVYAVKTFQSDRCMQNRIPVWECNVCSQLVQDSHPNISRIYQVFQNPAVPLFSIVMELCTGGDLHQKICSVRCAAKDGALVYQAPGEALSWLGQIFAGIEYLHLERDMLHLDVKPANVVIDAEGTAKLTDFGFCCLGTKSNGDFICGVPPGSPEYIAPEVLQGSGYSYSADLYSYGVLSWILHTGGVQNRHGHFSPPCADWHPPKTEPLLTNWQRLHEVVLDPAADCAPPRLDANIEDLVLKLTFRGDGWQPLQHDDIRQHVVFKDSDLLPCRVSYAV
jgi:thiamine kinase-like enzyme